MGKLVRFFAETNDGFNRADVLFPADVLRWHFLDRFYGPSGQFANEKPVYADLGRELGLSDEFVRNILQGKREPSKAFLKAAGYERVTLYRIAAIKAAEASI